MLQPSHIEHLNTSELVEARVRLVVGLKRYFHGKRVEGLLSSAVCFHTLFVHSSVLVLQTSVMSSMTWHGWGLRYEMEAIDTSWKGALSGNYARMIQQLF